MDYATLMAGNGHADQHAKKTMQEIASRLLDWCPAEVTSLTMDVDEEANDWNHRLRMLCQGHDVLLWIELTSDAAEHAGEYRFRLLATVNETPVDLGFSDPPWVSGEGEANIDTLIQQLTNIELAVVATSKAINEAMHPM